MKRLLIALLLVIPLAEAFGPYEALDHGEQFIQENIITGHKGFLMEDLSIFPQAVYQNEQNYRLVYKIEADLDGKLMKRFLMIEMSKQGQIKKVYASALSPDFLL
ncbi:hypothetical protein GOV09_00690 [Candidatus Woesearchaeota archaeon]|nr:hypothetical protein [Candidatus Woesearchaeota archaeon]